MKRFIPFALFMLLCVLMVSGITRNKSPVQVSPLIGKPFPSIRVAERDLPALLDGEVTIVNIFASWCIPCQIEHHQLMQLMMQNDARIFGIAWKDKPENVSKWLDKNGSPYIHVLLDGRGDTTIPLGLTGVPETFIVDKTGKVVYHTNQPITDTTREEEILPLLERLQKE